MAHGSLVVPASQFQLVRILSPRIEQQFSVKLRLCTNDPQGHEEEGGSKGNKKIIIVTSPEDANHDETISKVKVIAHFVPLQLSI